MTMPDKVHFLCSCPDYIHGTGKPTKKKTTCKKCKGIKLPFVPIGGTVRMLSTPYVLDATVARNCVGTVRLPSTTAFGQQRQRPTILCGEHDPYDFLRQSRLLYTDAAGRGGDSNESPPFQAIISSSGNTLVRANRQLNAGNNNNNNKASRIIESFTPFIHPDSYRNRSILQTTINPYELVSSTLHNSEFSPSVHLYDLLARNEIHNGKLNGTVALRSRNEPNRFNVLETFRPNDLETIKSVSSTSSTPTPTLQKPPPVPALESLPLSVKSITDNVSKNIDATQTVAINKSIIPPPPPPLPSQSQSQSQSHSQPTTTTTSKFKSILKQPMVPARANINSISDQSTKDKTSDKFNGKRSFSQSVLDEQKMTSTASHFKSTLQKSNPKLNGSLQSIDTMRNGFKKIIKSPKPAMTTVSATGARILSGSATTGRCKKVQFNTEPVLVRPKSIDDKLSFAEFVREHAKSNKNALNTSTPEKKLSSQKITNGNSIGPTLNDTDIGKRCELNRGSQRRKPIQRSMSDRRERDSSGKLNFKDTTALRIKQTRASPQQLFQKPLISTCQRPTSPPPQLPTSNNKCSNAPQRPPRQQKKNGNKTAMTAEQQQQHTTKTDEAARAARIFGILPVSTINRNKIKIEPFSNSDIKPVKQVANDMAKGDSSIQKTSITINNDDCSSTINVNDRVKLYHSSVLIKNEMLATSTNESAMLSANDIETSSNKQQMQINEDSPTEIAIVYHNNNKNGKMNKPECLETISTNVSKTKTLICLDYKNNSDTEQLSHTMERDGKQDSQSSENILFNISKSFNSLNGPNKNGGNNEGGDSNDNDGDDDDNGDGDGDNLTKPFADSFILKLLNDPYLSYLLHGLEVKTIAKIIENSLVRLRASKSDMKSISTKETTEMDKLFLNRLHDIIKDERTKVDECDALNRKASVPVSALKNSINARLRTPNNEYYQNELFHNGENVSYNNDCIGDDKTIPVRKLYEILEKWKNGNDTSSFDSQSDHQYESICLNCDPIYEEINDKPPPLPINPPPVSHNANTLEKQQKPQQQPQTQKLQQPKQQQQQQQQQYKPMFLGATKYDIISYLVDAKERGIVPEESYTFKFLRRPIEDGTIPLEKIPEDNGKLITIIRNRDSIGSSSTGSSTGSSSSSSGTKLITPTINFDSNIDEHPLKGYTTNDKCITTSVERNDSGVGSETSKTSRTKYQPNIVEQHKSIPPIHLCEDCDEPIELQMLETTDIYTPIVCRNCSKKRAERREILWEFIETEKKYSRDLQIIIDEFYQPMLVAGLLTQDQLSAIFLNIEELLENSESFCVKIRDAFDAANEQGDDDLFTVDIGKIILDTSEMLCAFESYCIQQAAASLLLANMEKDKELLRIFLRVSQMENTVLRRMNLNSFLMVPVQRVTKYPLLLARLYKVTPTHLECRERLKEAQDKIECHLNRMNREAKDISTKLWRRLSSNPTRARETDIVNIKLRKIAMDILDWNHDKVHFVVEGKLLITHPTDNNWRKGRTIKLTPVNALLITNELASTSSSDHSLVNFPRYTSNKETAFLLLREKSGRYTLYREPFYLDRCVVCTESDSAEYFEVHEISSKDSFIFKADDDVRTKQWYNQLQYHAQGTGAWRKRRTALANIMINGMMLRS